MPGCRVELSSKVFADKHFQEVGGLLDWLSYFQDDTSISSKMAIFANMLRKIIKNSRIWEVDVANSRSRTFCGVSVVPENTFSLGINQRRL